MAAGHAPASRYRVTNVQYWAEGQGLIQMPHMNRETGRTVDSTLA